MRFHNPWIDPRVRQVRSKAAQAYLSQQGWRLLTADQPHVLSFKGPKPRKDPPVVHVPVREQARDYTQRVIELLTDLAIAEGRYAVDVLNDILQQTFAAVSIQANGADGTKGVRSKIQQ